MFTGVSSQLSMFQAEKDTHLLNLPVALAGDWHSSDASVLEFFIEGIKGKTTHRLLLMSNAYLLFLII